MKRGISVFVFLALVVSAGFVLGLDGSDTITVSANIITPEPDVIGIEVPDSLDFGDVVAGEESDIFDLYINNTGNVDITVTPALVNDSEEIFSYLFFRRVQSDPFSRIGEFSVNISKPVDGGIRTQRTYAILDLEDFPGEVNEDILNHQSDVIFWALPQ